MKFASLTVRRMKVYLFDKHCCCLIVKCNSSVFKEGKTENDVLCLVSLLMIISTAWFCNKVSDSLVLFWNKLFDIISGSKCYSFWCLRVWRTETELENGEEFGCVVYNKRLTVMCESVIILFTCKKVKNAEYFKQINFHLMVNKEFSLRCC